MRSDMTDKLGTWILMVAIGCSACRAPEKLARPAQQAAPSRVLFVGNSFTFYNNGLHNLYRAMVRERGGDTRGIRALTLSGGTLSEHRAGLGQRLAEQRWDAVVLQGHSRGPLVDLDAFLRAAAGCSEQVREQGARPWLMMTWAYEGAPGMTASLAAGYDAAALRAGAAVAPVGLAFARVTDAHPEVALRMADGKHPTLAGSYLAACTLFAALRAESPIGLAYSAGLPETVASILQRAAWHTVQELDVRDR